MYVCMYVSIIFAGSAQKRVNAEELIGMHEFTYTINPQKRGIRKVIDTLWTISDLTRTQKVNL